jgi:hypothetical protein
MANNIERVNYYEREYLRTYDFEAEQRYHMEMRRRLNMALHLWGIVEGAQIRAAQPPPGVLAYVEVTEGMVIDAYGREMVIAHSISIAEEDLHQRGITSTNTYPVWIAYAPELSTPPEEGYRICNLKDQYTRLRENYKIIIDSDFKGPTPPPPGPALELSDDPVRFPWAVKLGAVFYNATTHKVTDATIPSDRNYIGLRAQRVQAPTVTPSTSSAAHEEILGGSPIKAPLTLDVQPTLIAERNLIVGGNFPISIPAAPPFPKPDGNLKVTNDLFLNGTFYINKTSSGVSTWVDLDKYIRDIIPKITPHVVIKSESVAIPAQTVIKDTFTFTPAPFPITTKLGTVSGVEVVVGISGLRFQSVETIATLSGSANKDEPIHIEVVKTTVNWPSPTHPSYNLEVVFKVGPTLTTGAGPFNSIVQSFDIIYCVIFSP